MKPNRLLSIIALIAARITLFACNGDCLMCHEPLKAHINDNDHKVLKECIMCHNDTQSAHGTCGKDCFDCHSREKLYSNNQINEHLAIKACGKCHIEKIEFVSHKKSSLSIIK